MAISLLGLKASFKRRSKAKVRGAEKYIYMHFGNNVPLCQPTASSYKALPARLAENAISRIGSQGGALPPQQYKGLDCTCYLGHRCDF
jgi:hypothetical protein